MTKQQRQADSEIHEDQLRNVLVNALTGAFGIMLLRECIYYSEAKRGTTAFHAYARLYARVKNKRYTLAVRRVTHGDTASEVLAECPGLVDDFDVKAVYVNRDFYDGKCLTLMQAHNHAYVVPIVKWGTKIKNELSEGWSREIEHDLTTEFY